MPELSDTQPIQPQPAEEGTSGPGCLAWGLLMVAGGAFSLIVVLVAGLAGYITGQEQVNTQAEAGRAATIDAYLLEIPTRVAEGNTAYIEGYIDWFAQLTPVPTELAMLQATGTQLALNVEPTLPPLATDLPTLAATDAPTQTPAPALSPTATEAASVDVSDPNAPVYDPAALFLEAEAQIADGQLDEAAETLDALMGVDPSYRPDEVQQTMFSVLERQARLLLRSGDPANLALGIVKANQAEAYGDLGEVGYERYIAGLYLNAQSREGTNPLGAIQGYTEIYNQLPNYLDVQDRIFSVRVELGDEAYDRFDWCPAVVQYQAALQVASAPDVQQRLETAQTSCAAGATAPPNLTPGVVNGSTGSGSVGSTPPPTSEGVAPIGAR